LNSSKANLSRLTVSITLLSVALIAFQLSLIQILSIVQWYHFAYMVISIALMGFGSAGTFISLFRKFLLKKDDTLLPVFIILSGILMAISVLLSQSEFIRFDSYRLFVEQVHIWKLAITYFVLFLPFFFGATAIGMIFIKHVKKIGRLYSANMIGSGLGSLTVIGIMWFISPQNLPPFISVFALLAGIIIVPKLLRKSFTIIVFIFFAILSYLYFNPVELHLSEYKDLSKALNNPNTRILKEKTSPYGLIDIVSSPYIRYAPGLSIKYPGIISPSIGAFDNGNWAGPITTAKKDSIRHFHFYTEYLPYLIRNRHTVLILNSGTGRQIRFAIDNNADLIDAVEPNKALVNLISNEFVAETDSLFNNRIVRPKNISPRTFLLQTHSKYDLVTLPVTGSFGGSSGLFSLQEQYLYTKESFSDMFSLLSVNGSICVSTWIDYPYRNSLKILSTISEVLSEKHIINPKEYIVAIKNWNTITFLIKNNPLTEFDTHKILEYCHQMNFDPVLLPKIKNSYRNKFNKLQDTLFFSYFDRIISSQREREKLYSEYPFNIRPATDTQPYFSQFLTWKSLPQLSRMFGSGSVPFFEIGYLILYLTFGQIIILSFVLIILPLFRLKWKGENKVRTLLYFSGIGIGYMFIEIILIQRFILYFGNVIYAAAAVVCLMLISSGLGSLVSQKISSKPSRVIGIFLIIILSLIIYAFTLSSILRTTIIFTLPVKIIFAILLITPAAFFMGMPFPLGLRILSEKSENQIPWAWGINGIFSVISTVLAVIVAIELGFVWVMVFAVSAYGLALIFNLRRT
jgi:hypothetical protein